jgi:hypothetical protein
MRGNPGFQSGRSVTVSINGKSLGQIDRCSSGSPRQLLSSDYPGKA